MASNEQRSVIELQGIRVHNLQIVNLRLPLRMLIAITGVSGAGKSSLAFDTLVAEGRRRYIETFSTSARHYLERIERPDADAIENIPTAVAFRACDMMDERATLGSLTEIDELLQILLSRVGQVFCPNCHTQLQAQAPDEVVRQLQTLAPGTKFVVAFPIDDASPIELDSWRHQGFVRAVQVSRMTDPTIPAMTFRVEPFDLAGGGIPAVTSGKSPTETGSGKHVWIVVDRLVAGKSDVARLTESVEQAFQLSGGKCVVLSEHPCLPPESSRKCNWDGKPWHVALYSRRLVCFDCDSEFPELEPDVFSSGSPLGACPTCSGLGKTKLNDRWQTCMECEGTRLQGLGRCVRLGRQNPQTIVQLRELPLEKLVLFVNQAVGELSAERRAFVTSVVDELQQRLATPRELSLGYLSLGRSLRSLSRGERQRARLAALLAVRLDDALYVLDEPGSGLHPSEQPRVLDALRRLQYAGNTVIVVEHQRAFIESADQVIDLGPGAGRAGGHVVFQGTPSDLLSCDTSLTAAHLRGDATGTGSKSSTAILPRTTQPTGTLRLDGVTLHNLRSVSVDFPLGVLCVVAGVSGSGKSSLVEHTLFPALCRRLGKAGDVEPEGQLSSLSGAELIEDVLFVDSTTLGKSARANAATLMHVFSEIRQLFAQTTDAKVKNFTARHFSFNAADGGRCSRCKGLGSVEIDMDFLADLSVVCPDCHGSRFHRDTLDIKLRGLSIAELLNLTADEAFTFFRGQPRLQRALKCLKDVGLGYLPLGQSAGTLSRGERQRLKLATFLGSRSRARTLFLMDEPTAGLHPADVEVLIGCLRRLTDVGHSLIVIEHRPEFIRRADWVIELGPGAGDAGGQVVSAGPPR